jgi:hypothetical protein
LETANPKPIEERAWYDLEVTRQRVGNKIKYLFYSCLKIMAGRVVTECPLIGSSYRDRKNLLTSKTKSSY